MKLIIGLGNPGKKYASTRHNAGWDVVSELVKELNASFSKKPSLQSEIAESIIDDIKILMIHPLTFMNLSGHAVASILNYYKCKKEDVLIVHDDMDYTSSIFAFTEKNGPGGHNGVASIQESLSTKEITRLRIGIGRPQTERAKESYVLEKFSKEEKKAMKTITPHIINAIKDWISLGTTKAMNKWNTK